MNTKVERKEINSLYFLKGICAFLVVCCHAPWAGVFNEWIAPLRMAAVPFFLTISGYFLYREDGTKMGQALQKTLLKLVPIIIICNLFYLLWVYPNHGWLLRSWSQVWDLLLYGGAVIGHLWYLTAFAWAVVFYRIALWLLAQISTSPSRTFMYLVYALIPLYILAVMALSYAPWTYDAWGLGYKVYACIPYALPYMALGFVIKRYEQSLLRSRWTYRAMAMGVILFVEFVLSNHLSSEGSLGVLFSSMPFVFCVFLALLQKDTLFNRGRVILIGRKYSGNIYYWHMAMITVGIKLTQFLGFGSEQFDYVAAPVGFALAWLVSVLVVGIQERLKISILP